MNHSKVKSASHLNSHSRLCRDAILSLLSRHKHRKVLFSVAMNPRMENRKIFVQTRDENIEIEFLPTVFGSLVGTSVCLQRA